MITTENEINCQTLSHIKIALIFLNEISYQINLVITNLVSFVKLELVAFCNFYQLKLIYRAFYSVLLKYTKYAHDF